MCLRHAYFVLLLFLTTQGCVSTQVSSITDSAFTSVLFQDVLVYANTNYLDWRTEIEEELVRDISTKTDATAIKSLELVTPTHQYTGQEVAGLIYASRVDSVLWINILVIGTHPETTCIREYQEVFTSCYEEGARHASINAFLLSAKDVDGAGYDFMLANRLVGQSEAFSQTGVVWTSTVESYGRDSIASYGKIRERISSKLVGALITDGMLEKQE